MKRIFYYKTYRRPKHLVSALWSLCLFLFTAQLSQAQYCATINNDANPQGSLVSDIVFGSISNFTGAVWTSPNGYNYYSSQTTSVIMGASENLSITIDAAGTYTGGITSVWIDWDQSGTLDASEHFYVGPGSLSAGIPSGTTVTVSVPIPLTATPGLTRMRIRTRGNGNQNLPTDACTTFGSGETEDYDITVVPATACSGTPVAGTAVVSKDSVCINSSYTVSLSGATIASGLTYQWYESPVGANSWTPIATGVGANYATTMTAGGDMDYFCEIACGSAVDSSTIVTVYQNPFYACYCASATQYTQDGEIYNVTVGSLNNTSTCLQTGGPGSLMNRYSDYTSVVTPDTLYQDVSYPISVTAGACNGYPYSAWVKVWIDLDQDGAFTSPGEELFSGTTPSTMYTPAGDIASGNIILPSASFPLTGLTRMRVILWQSTTAGPVVPCQVNSPYNYGETEDYLVYIPGIAPACTAAVAGTAASNKDSVCANANFTLTATGYSSNASGLTYQWEESPLGAASWNPIANATNPSYTGSQTADMEYRFSVTCGATTNVSNTVPVTMAAFYVCYCASSATYTGDGEISNVSFGALNNSSTCSQTGGPGSVQNLYSNYTNLTPDTIYQDNIYPLSVTAASCGGSYAGYVKVWIDLDQDGAFTTTGEEVMSMAPPGGNYTPAGVITSTNVNLSSTLFPLTGLTRMRVVMMENGSQTATLSCGTFGYGETEDYLIYIPGPAPACSGVVTAGTISSNKDSVCVGNESFTLTATGYTSGLTGIEYQWEESPVGANTWTAITNATNPSYIGTQIGDMDYHLTVTCLNTSSTASSNTVTITTSPFYTCYCSPKTGTTLHTCCGNYITNVTISNTTLNNSSTTYGTGYYTQYSNSVASQTADMAQGVGYPISVSCPYTGYGADVWVDFDQSGTFDASEYFSLTTSGTMASGNILVPVTANLGSTGLRVRNWYSPYGAGGACSSSSGYETEDYIINILPAPTCIPPSGVNATNVTSSSADIGWTVSSGASQWQIEFGATPYTQGTGTILTVSSNPYSITSGLNPSTQYAFYVRDICGAGDTSTWTSGGTFTTACVAFSAPFVESFNGTSTPICWSNPNAVNYNWMFSTSLNNGYGLNITSDHTGNSGGRFAWVDNSYIYNGTTPSSAALTSPLIDISTLTAPQLRYYVVSFFNSTLTPGNNKLIVDAYDFNISDWVQIDSIQQNFASQAWEERNIPLTAVTSTITQIRFTNKGANGCCYNDILIDDVNVEQMPTCPAPTALIVNNPTASSLDVSWTSNGSATQYQIEYAQGTTGYTPNTGVGTLVGPTGVTNPYTVSSLIQGTPYTFYVREICGAGDTSSWLGPVTGVTAFPTTPPNDDCITAIDISNGAWYYGSTAGATQSLAACDATTASTTDVWYSFTTGSSAGTISDSVNTIFSGMDAVVQLFSGSCTGTLTSVTPTSSIGTHPDATCIDGPLAGEIEWANYSVAANTTYYIRVYTYGTLTPGAFSIKVFGAPLAIKLDKLSAVNIGASNKVEWNTLSEERSDKFELERSVDGKNFATIYKKAANGEASRYTYMDNSPVKGYNYYRLRMIEANGNATYSEVVKAFVKSTGFEVEAYPNPVSHDLTVKVSGVQGADAAVQVTDVTGKVIRTIKMTGNVETINMSGLANGIYMIKYSDANHTQTIRVNKQ